MRICSVIGVTKAFLEHHTPTYIPNRNIIDQGGGKLISRSLNCSFGRDKILRNTQLVDIDRQRKLEGEEEKKKKKKKLKY